MVTVFSPLQSPLVAHIFLPQRCDGTKPACQQCQRAKKGDLCEYDDGKGKTRTQVLRENIAKLEARIRELEDPDRNDSSITLFDPHALLFSEESSSSSAGSPSSLPFSTSHSPYPFGASVADSPYLLLTAAPPRRGIPHTPTSDPIHSMGSSHRTSFVFSPPFRS